ncbi:hypothetical protein EDF46_1070 [Frondihabitans sp. PhB188]|uniref:hypothetical protein n=1 Tax=Frondihabitans sp. PhB188 TaxID=2485200 RepID=UPI000F4739F0|nr:hypothetical protein [Frondihabitans sp. PhB188]ROQ39439.1 hypothetical protein EDF46_1070 [Frondihabitans sp. PhB188]
MTLADLRWISSDQRPHGVLLYDPDDVDWVDASGRSPLGVVQPVRVGSEFEVSFVVPGNVRPTSDLLDSALPELGLWLAYGVDDLPSELVVTPSIDTSTTDITATWSDDGPVRLDGFDEARAEMGWSSEQAAEARTWIDSTIDLARRLQPHIELTAERVEDDIAHGFTISMPFGDNENIDGGYIATVLLETDAEDAELDPEAVKDLGLDGARAWTAVVTQFPGLFLTEACGYYGFEVAEPTE